MNKIYIDCTMTYNSNLHTGIQRVVRKVITHALSNPRYVNRIQPVIWTPGGFIPVVLVPHAYEMNPDLLGSSRFSSRRLAALGRNAKKLLHSAAAGRVQRYLMKSPWLYRRAQGVYARLMGIISRGEHRGVVPIIPAAGDILLLLDAAWSVPMRGELESFRAEGGFVAAVMYDLIPITHESFCSDPLVANFHSYMKMIVHNADMLIGISKTVKEDILNYIRNHYPQRYEKLRFDYFYLGSDRIGDEVDEMLVRDSIRAFFASSAPVYLTVSTIEPRKNHRYILDAFDRLWGSGREIRLCFIGREGWKVDALMERIRSHPRLGSSFLVLNDASDAELFYAYKHAKALIFPSVAEGFGLPIIEALTQALPVIASDIPVHREIAQDQIVYVDIADPDALVEAICKDKVKFPSKSYRWMDWDESCEMLLSRLPGETAS